MDLHGLFAGARVRDEELLVGDGVGRWAGRHHWGLLGWAATGRWGTWLGARRGRSWLFGRRLWLWRVLSCQFGLNGLLFGLLFGLSLVSLLEHHAHHVDSLVGLVGQASFDLGNGWHPWPSLRFLLGLLWFLLLGRVLLGRVLLGRLWLGWWLLLGRLWLRWFLFWRLLLGRLWFGWFLFWRLWLGRFLFRRLWLGRFLFWGLWLRRLRLLGRWSRWFRLLFGWSGRRARRLLLFLLRRRRWSLLLWRRRLFRRLWLLLWRRLLRWIILLRFGLLVLEQLTHHPDGGLRDVGHAGVARLPTTRWLGKALLWRLGG